MGNNGQFRVLALPATDFNVDFYYTIQSQGYAQDLQGYYQQQSQSGGLSDADITRIAEAVSKSVALEFDKSLSRFLQSLEGEGGEGEVNPNPTLPRDVELEVPENIRGIIRVNCLNCHDDDNPQGRDRQLDLANFRQLREGKTEWEPLKAIDAWHLFDAVHSGYMPLNSSPLSDEDAEAFRIWARDLSK